MHIYCSLSGWNRWLGSRCGHGGGRDDTFGDSHDLRADVNECAG
jgi:hypothetical protein